MCLGGRIHGRRCCPPHVKPAPAPPVIVPLIGASASVKVIDYTAEVTIQQRYENQESDPIEAVYEFPLDPEAAVVDFHAVVDDKKIVGTIKEKEKAKDTYDDAIASGHGAYLLEKKDDSNIFSASIGNLPPGKEVLVVITYITELSFDEGKLKLVLPANPYPPNGTTSPKFALPKNNNTPLSKQVPYGLKININLDMTSNIRSISSLTHPIQFEFSEAGPSKATVTLSQQEDGVPLGKDFELLLSLAQPNKPIVRVEPQANGDTVAMVALHPDLPEEQIFTEMVFLVDRSGSMSGSRINQVKDTLQIFLRSLPEGTLFNIIGFGTRFEKLFPESKEYNENTLQVATQHCEKMSANLGGTNLLSPLKAIFEEKSKEGIPRQLFILTDGEVDNTQACLDEVRLHADTTRVFTFGIGADASKHLVAGMAKQGEGKAEFIRSGEAMDDKVMRQLTRALKPALVDLKVDWGSQVQQTPYHLPPLFGGGRLVAYAFFEKGAKLPAEVVLHANTATGPKQFSASIDPATHTVQGSQLSKLAAKSMIRDLEESRSSYHDNKGNLVDKNVNIADKVTQLSISSKVISKYTAFVAVEKREDATEGNMQLRKMEMTDYLTTPNKPAPAPFGAKALHSSTIATSSSSVKLRKSKVSADRGAAPVKNVERSRSAKPESMHKDKDKKKESVSFFARRASPKSSDSSDDEDEEAEVAVHSLSARESFAPAPSLARKEEEKAPAPPASNVNLMRDIIKKQRANGSFSLEALKLFLPSTTTMDSVKKAFPSTTVSLTDALVEIFITIIVCEYLKLKFADQFVNWNLIAKKAQAWAKKEAEKAGLGSLDFEGSAAKLIK